MTDPMELVGEGSALSRFGHQAAPMDTKVQRALARKAMREAAACIREMVGWRPIETAPRDGAVFLVGYDDKIAKSARLEAHQRVYEARWCERQQSFAARNGFILHYGATHWLPLPPAPGAEA